jgi:thioredoxin reductase
MPNSDVKRASVVDVVLIGAGPYGLSIAAHLAARGVSFRIFGKPMYAWASQMPKGMKLKSEGFASSLSDPESEFTLAHYCRQEGLPYQDSGLPVPLETFVSYGMAFQKRFVPNLEDKMVVSIHRTREGFELQLDDGVSVLASKVILAVGISQFANIPEVLSELPDGLVSHSSAHSDLQKFNGRRVAVIGAGASALDIAALLHQVGASVQVIARGSKIKFHDPPKPRPLYQRILNPATGIGVGRVMLFYTAAPQIFRLLPEEIRLDRVQKTLGPAPGWFIRDEVVGKVSILLNTSITSASTQKGCVNLKLSNGNETQTIEVDHVIAATGYRIDLERLNMLSGELRKEIRLTGKSPFLSSHFESSVPGLYFVGVAAANTFGPVMRFAYGAEFTARRLSRQVARAVRKSPEPLAQPTVQQISE